MAARKKPANVDNVDTPTRARARRAPGGQIANAWRPEFIEALRKTGLVSSACSHAGISRARAYAVRKDDREFEKEWDDALEDAVDLLEGMALRRAMDPGDRDSARLLMFILAARKPDKYGRQVRHGGIADAPVRFVVSPASDRSADGDE